MEANRKNINAAFAKMQQEAKQLGVVLLTKPEVFIDDDHLCCVWYGGYIGGFMYKDYTVALEVHGDVVICGVVDGKEIKMEVQKGQKVITGKYTGTEVKLDGEKYIIVRQSDILAIVE